MDSLDYLGKRVQIPAYRDEWMRGDRYGQVDGRVNRNRGYLWVVLDKSGKRIKVLADDCTVID
jgi:hypothetical protein